jgi:hypothetical protein
MAAQQGFQYEKNAADVLKKLGIVPMMFQPAGAGHDQPDLKIMKPGGRTTSGCELKISAASAGSLVMKYDINDTQNPWKFGDIKATEDEKLFIRDLAYEVGVFDTIKEKWTAIPAKREKDANWKAFHGSMSNREMYERDKALFKDVKGSIPASKIEEYYVKKKTYYVNVGTHGFYLLGKTNPLGLKGVPLFSSAASATYRARVQYKGSGNYQFTFEMQFSIPALSKSPFNIAPVDGKSVNIIEKNLNLACFL